VRKEQGEGAASAVEPNMRARFGAAAADWPAFSNCSPVPRLAWDRSARRGSLAGRWVGETRELSAFWACIHGLHN
jgi:hypothetical protein